jgi:alpha-beta hydrolase superfamily lysophospholipase
MPGPTVTREEHSFVDDYGVTIHYYVWRPTSARGIAQVVHGLGEYAIRYEPFIQELVADGYVVYADDHRGHGKTGLEQWDGDHSKLGHLGKGGVRATAKEIHDLTVRARSENPGLPLVAIGQSLGSLLLQMILNEHSDAYDAVVLTATAYRTFFQMESGDLNKRHAHLGTSGGQEWLTRDVAMQQSFKADPLTFQAKAAKLFGLLDGARLLGTPTKLSHDVPIHIVIGDEDPLGGPRSVELLAQAYRTRGGLSDVTVVVYPGARHEVFHETNRVEVVAEIIAWLDTKVASSR